MKTLSIKKNYQENNIYQNINYYEEIKIISFNDETDNVNQSSNKEKDCKNAKICIEIEKDKLIKILKIIIKIIIFFIIFLNSNFCTFLLNNKDLFSAILNIFNLFK